MVFWRIIKHAIKQQTAALHGEASQGGDAAVGGVHASPGDTLAWATGTRVGAGDHAIALFCIGCGRVLGFLYSDTFILHFEV